MTTRYERGRTSSVLSWETVSWPPLTAPCPSAHLNLARRHWLEAYQRKQWGTNHNCSNCALVGLHIWTPSPWDGTQAHLQGQVREMGDLPRADHSSPTWTRWVSPPTYPKAPANVPLKNSPHTLAFSYVSIHTSQPLWVKLPSKPPPWQKKILRDTLN